MIEINHLSYKIKQKTIIDDITMRLSPGKIYALMGPNGVGKTTFFRCLSGIYEADAGTITLRGKEIDPSSREWKQNISLVPDQNALFDELTIQEHLKLVCAIYNVGTDEAHRRIEKLIRLFDLKEYRHYQSKNLSFGFNKRLAIALSLLYNAGLFLFDEPLSGLDAGSINLFNRILTFLKDKGKTVLICSHYISLMQNVCDVIHELYDAKIVNTIDKDRQDPVRFAKTYSLDNEGKPELTWIG